LETPSSAQEQLSEHNIDPFIGYGANNGLYSLLERPLIF
jgi:hypothetical protein